MQNPIDALIVANHPTLIVALQREGNSISGQTCARACAVFRRGRPAGWVKPDIRLSGVMGRLRER